MFSLQLPDTFWRHPHASLFVIFISAFTLFALTGEDNELTNKPKKKKSLLSKIMNSLTWSDEEFTELQQQSTSTKAPTIHIPSSSGLADACKDLQNLKTRVQSFVNLEEPLDETQRALLEQLINQLQEELAQERLDKDRARESLKLEEQLRQASDENLELMKQEMNNQAKILEKERSRVARLEYENRQQKQQIAYLQAQLQEKDNQLQEMAQALEAAKNAVPKETPNEHSSNGIVTPPLLRKNSTGEKKRVFTII